MEKVNKEPKKSIWKQLEDILGAMFIVIFSLIFLIGIVYLSVTLIENPVSLAILCLTIFLIIVWSRR
jgi:tetrahydromethanopterin S-methyltransferase subunit E